MPWGSSKSDDTSLLQSINADIANWEQERDAEAISKLDEILAPQILFRQADKTS